MYLYKKTYSINVIPSDIVKIKEKEA